MKVKIHNKHSKFEFGNKFRKSKHVKKIYYFSSTVRTLPFRYNILYNFLIDTESTAYNDLQNNMYEYISNGVGLIVESLLNNDCLNLLDDIESIFNKSNSKFKGMQMTTKINCISKMFEDYIKKIHYESESKKFLKSYIALPSLVMSKIKVKNENTKIITWNDNDTLVKSKQNNIILSPIHYVVALSYFHDSTTISKIPSVTDSICFVNNKFSDINKLLNHNAFKNGAFSVRIVNELDSILNIDVSKFKK